MGKYRMGVPQELAAALKTHSGIGHFVETGTYRGDTASWAAEIFPEVTTIELSAHYFATAKARFAQQPRVRVLNGPSEKVLARFVPGLSQPAFFWLDAHWSGLDTGGREAECPLLQELGVINQSPLQHIILVDDARLFCAPPARPHLAEKWPDLKRTLDLLSGGERRHVVIYEDVFVAAPMEQRCFLDSWLQDAATTARKLQNRPAWKRMLDRWT